MSATRMLAVVALALAGWGCATVGPRDREGLPIADTLAALEKGEIRLTCRTACAAYYGGFRPLQKARYDRQQWKELAIDVARIGYQIDQSYFYLGRAAEGLGHVKAARTYYELAIASRAKCDRLLDVCDGFVFPDDALARLQALPPP